MINSEKICFSIIVIVALGLMGVAIVGASFALQDLTAIIVLILIPLTIIACVIVLILSDRQKKAFYRDNSKQFEEVLDEYLDALVKQKTTLTTLDVYGMKIDAGWLKSRNYFIEKVLPKHLSQKQRVCITNDHNRHCLEQTIERKIRNASSTSPDC